MLKRNSGITDTKPKPDDTADKQSTKNTLTVLYTLYG